MSQPSENWTAEEVALWLGFKSADHFARKREDLIARFGFPRPLPGMQRLVWSGVSLLAWQASLLDEPARKALAQMGGIRLSARDETLPIAAAQWNDVLIDRLEGRAV